MAAGLDKEFLSTLYNRLPDQELLRIISQDAHGLTPQAVEVIRAEIARRGLDPGLGDLVAAQNKVYTKEELDEYCRLIEPLRCPKCHMADTPLTAALISRTISVIYITFHKEKLVVACPDCVRTDNDNAHGISLLLGWWGIPSGPIKTIQSMRSYQRSYDALQQPGPNDFLRSFVAANIGLLMLYKEDKERLGIIIRNMYMERPITTQL